MIRRYADWLRALLMLADTSVAVMCLIGMWIWRPGPAWSTRWREIIPQAAAFLGAHALQRARPEALAERGGRDPSLELLTLRPNGRLVVLQPNIRLVGGASWDFVDHRVALTGRSLVEAAELAGLRAIEVRMRFQPYSTKRRPPTDLALSHAYLAFPPASRLMGKQTLCVGERPG
jgi:hypothetical protein